VNLLTTTGNTVIGGSLTLGGTGQTAIQWYDLAHATGFVISGPTTGYNQTIYTPGAALTAGAPLGLNSGNQLSSVGFTGDATNIVSAVPTDTLTVVALRGTSVSSSSPTSGQQLRIVGGIWTPVNLNAPNYESWCNGVIGATLSTEYYLFPGSTSATAGSPCTGTASSGMPISGACTASALIAKSSAAGKDSTSGVVTVYRNGSPSAMTCTMGTATSCSDGTDTIAFSSGDTFYVGVESSTTNATDTTANLRVAFQCQ